MDDELNNLTELMAEAILEKNSKKVQEYSRKVIISLLDENNFPEYLFNKISDFISNEKFQRWADSFLILKVFEDNIEILTDDQKLRLINVFKSTFERFEETASCILIVEIIAEIYRDKRSLDVLRVLKAVHDDFHRSIVPLGYEHFIENCENPALVKNAKEDLLTMRFDKSDVVRDEAEVSIGRCVET